MEIKTKLINCIKWIGFSIKLVFWVLIVILSFGFALLLLPEDVENEYFDTDYEKKKEKKVKK